MSVGAIGAEILGGGGIHPPPWYTSLKHVMALGVKGRGLGGLGGKIHPPYD